MKNHRFNKPIALLLTFVFVICASMCFPLTANAGEMPDEGTPVFTYRLLDDGTIELTSCENCTETVQIPATVDGYKVSGLDMFLFGEESVVKNVIIPFGVKLIDTYAFSMCRNLESVSIPTSVTEIGNYAFGLCPNLKKFDFTDHIARVGDYAFFGCDNLLSIRIPESVSIIGHNAFGFTENPSGENQKIEGFTLWGYKNSAAESYAKNSDIAFQIISDEYLLGDANGSRNVSIRDVTAIQRHLADYKMIDGNRLDLSDVDCDNSITINDATYIQNYLAEFLDADIDLQIAQNDYTTTEAKQTLSGTYNSAVKVKSIQYTIESEEGVEIETGDAAFSDGAWQLQDILLAPGQNTVTISANALGGVNSESVMCIEYNNGYEYDYNDSDIITEDNGDGESEEICLDNILLVTFESNVPETRKTAIVQSIGGEIVGSINAIDLRQVKIPKKSTKAELDAVCAQLSAFEEVTDATTDDCYETDTESCPFNDEWDGNINWNGVVSMDQANWWCKAINLPEAWEYLPLSKRINVGVIDNGFDTDHEDLNIYFPNKEEREKNGIERLDGENEKSHGTHVAGLIGAMANNKIGIAGTNPKARLICSDWDSTYGQKVTSFFFKKHTFEFEKSLVALVESKAKVINLSAGLIVDNEKLINDGAHSISRVMGKLLKDHDFVVVQSAGNNHIPAERNGWFCSINQSNCYKDKTSASYQEIKDRIIIVGNAEKSEYSYKLQDSPKAGSNYGSNVDIAAPGTNIYSTLINNQYGRMTGTSMAAPIVAGAASMVWGLNPSLTGAEVKNIICSTAGPTVEASSYDSEGTTYRLLDAKKAADAAISQSSNLRLAYYDKEEKMPILCEVTLYRLDDETGNTFKKYRQYYLGESLKTNLPNGTYKIEIDPIYDAFEPVTYTFDINDPSFYCRIIYLEKKEVASPVSDFIYTVEDGNVTITGYRGSGGDIVIPSKIDGLPVKKIGDSAFRNNKTITSVTFNRSLNMIDQYAFYQCSALRTVNIAGAVGTIDNYAFDNCKKLERFYASEAVYSIGAMSFDSCENLYYFGVQDKIKYVGAFAFLNCKSLYDFELPPDATYSQYAFMGTNTKYNNWTGL